MPIDANSTLHVRLSSDALARIIDDLLQSQYATATDVVKAGILALDEKTKGPAVAIKGFEVSGSLLEIKVIVDLKKIQFFDNEDK